MEIIRADRSGFCFGVQRAIDLTMEQIEKNEKGEKRPLYTCGPLIHNRSVTGALEEKGVGMIQNIEEASEGDVVIIRSHGETRQVLERLEAMETKLAAIEKGGFTIAQPAAQVSVPAAEQTQTAEPRQTIAPQQAETARAKPQPEAKQQQSNAKALWETVRRAIQIKNPTLAVLGMKCECQIEGDALFARFPKRTIADAFMKPEMLKVAQDALSAAANGMSIRFGAAEMKNESVAETAKKAFGPMIEIVE